MNKFTQQFFINNRDKLRARVAADAVCVLSANGLLQRRGDTTYPFSQDPNFWYLTGIESPDVLLVMSAESDFLILPTRSEVSELFGGAIDKAKLADISGIDKIYPHDEGWNILKKMVKATNNIALLPLLDVRDAAHDMYRNQAHAAMVGVLGELNSQFQTIDLTKYLARLRMIKQDAEKEAIAEACNTSGRLFGKISQIYAQSKSEKDLHRAIEFERAKSGLTWAYDPIIADGSHANTLHYIDADDSRLVGPTLFDIGYQHGQYAADISRTYISGSPKVSLSRYNAVYQAAIEVYQAACATIRPGVSVQDLERTARRKMSSLLVDLGLSKEKSLEDVARFFPHALGHHVGLEVHDIQSSDDLLQEGMVITIEPGIYIPAENFGVRYENTLLVTKTGYKNLCSLAPERAV